jgi:hypothetical protein
VANRENGRTVANRENGRTVANRENGRTVANRENGRTTTFNRKLFPVLPVNQILPFSLLFKFSPSPC